MTETSGASVIVPAGALTTDTTIRIARDSTGAPALPADLPSAGSMYVITPHGGAFAEGVEVRIPAPNVTLQPNQQLKLAKAEPGGEWVVWDDTELNAGTLRIKVDGFSYFVPVVVTYQLPIAQAEPFRAGGVLTCAGASCGRSFGTVNATYTVSTNNGQLPANCNSPALAIFASAYSVSYSSTSSPNVIPMTGGSLTRAVPQTQALTYKFGVGLRCGSWSRIGGSEGEIRWVNPPGYPNVQVLKAPATLDLVEGIRTDLEVVLGGGATSQPNQPLNPLSATNRTVIDWQRSDDNGASWRDIARSYENDANPWPYAAPSAWLYWSVSHGFVATIADQGALIRTHACYTSRDAPTTTSCDTGPPTRLNVLQQSALPAIVDAPRSVLIRTGQTASLSVTASGLPAPTLRWQTRAANSNDAWSDVTGPGANTANYTTAPLTLADNGVQYRVVAINSLGSVESTGVTISVSDLDVAPAITTQPGNLSVTSGGDAVFAVVARGTEALSYQWSRNGAPIVGANSPVLRLTGVTNAAHGGVYGVTVSNGAGTVDSNAVLLTVTAGTPAAVAPSIVTQPAAVTVNAGNTATFAVGVDGSGPFTFAWRKDGVAIPGATSAVLTLSSVSASSAGDYSVAVSNAVSANVVSSAAALTVLTNGAAVAPTITTQPSTVVIASGGSGILAVAAAGSGPLSYQWLADGVPIVGKTQPVLTFSNVDSHAEGNYSVTVTNSLGSVVSQEVDVILLGSPLIAQDPANNTVFENTSATFSVVASGSALRYQWLRNGAVIPGADQASYTTPLLTVANSGAVYSVIVFNGAGVELSTGAVLTVQAFVAPTVLQQPANVSIQAGSTASLCVAFGGTPPFSVQMSRWSGVAWVPVGAAVSINDNAQSCMSTPALQVADSGAQFRFVASHGGSEATTNAATVTVTAPFNLTTTTLVSVSSTGVTADNSSYKPSLSADGRMVAFITDGTNLVPGFTNPPGFGGHAYVRDLTTGVTTLINQTPSGGQSTWGVNGLKLAAGGRFVVFTSLSGDLVAGDTNGSQDVFLRDLQTGVTKRLNLRPDGSEVPGSGSGQSDMQVDISADGRFVSFVYGDDLMGTGAPATPVLYLRDTQTDQTRVVGSNPSYGIAYSALASDGATLAYADVSSQSTAIVLHDISANTTGTLYTFNTNNVTDYLAQGLSISGNGRFVAFAVRSPALLNGSTVAQVVGIDRNFPSSIITASAGANGVGDGASSYPKLSDDGHVLFATYAANLTGNANPGRQMLVVRDLQGPAISVASRTPAGAAVWTASGVYDSHALSRDGTVLALVADEYDMTGNNAGHQVYVAPRP